VPPASHSPTGTTSQGSILLIEEYDALASAISSALRKFAPRHQVKVARSLAEAKTLAKETAPDLFIVDFDPAFPGLSAFLQKMQKAHSDARVLILAGKLPPEIAVAAHSVGALQFVEKPFDVPDFGAAVQALLGSWTEPGTATSRGTLQDVGLADLLLAQCAGGRTAAIEVKNDAGKSGEIDLRQGVPVHGETGRKSGNEAFGEMLRWTDVDVREREKPKHGRRTIDDDWTDILLKALPRLKTRKVRPPKISPAEKPRAKTGKKLVVVDDTEMLLIFVEDVLTTADRELQIATALNGISGIKEIERVMPDLVLLDYSLPDINGDEVCRRLLQQAATAKIPVLMMSGHVPEMSKAAATLDNVVATIAKPFLSDALVSLVQQTLTEPPPVRKKNGTARKAPPPSPKKPEPPPIQIQAPSRAKAVESAKLPKPIAPEEAHINRIAPAPERPTRAAPPPPPPPPPTKPPRRVPSEEPQLPGLQTISTPVFSDNPNDVVLTLFLDVVSAQLTPELRMGSIRAKPSSTEVSLHVISPGVRASLPETGFKLGQVGLDGKGRIATMRLIPTLAPFKSGRTQSALQIGAVIVVPFDST
jgi:DNA-binding response OmpR family regulator